MEPKDPIAKADPRTAPMHVKHSYAAGGIRLAAGIKLQTLAVTIGGREFKGEAVDEPASRITEQERAARKRKRRQRRAAQRKSR